MPRRHRFRTLVWKCGKRTFTEFAIQQQHLSPKVLMERHPVDVYMRPLARGSSYMNFRLHVVDISRCC
ncbi:unnamed protein product [Lathyrus sativus]|nr:unnamed protein product [Lathyrus sativus]